MAASFQEATFGFRFISLSSRELDRLQELLPTVALTSRFKSAGFVVSFDVTEEFDVDSLCTFINESQVDSRMYSVWISLITGTDQGGISLPAHMLTLVRRTFGGVDFSFASSLGDGIND